MTELRRDRTGELIEVLDDPVHECEDGWINALSDRVSPCPICRPQLVERLRGQRRTRR